MNIIKQLQDANGNNIYPIAYAQGGMKVDLVWTNPDSTTSYGENTISIDLSGYDFIYIVVRSAYNADTMMTWVWKIDGTRYRCDRAGTASSNNTGFRYITPSSSGIVCSACTYNGATNNQYLIPHQVYGIKLSYIVPTTVNGLQYVEV